MPLTSWKTAGGADILTRTHCADNVGLQLTVNEALLVLCVSI